MAAPPAARWPPDDSDSSDDSLFAAPPPAPLIPASLGLLSPSARHASPSSSASASPSPASAPAPPRPFAAYPRRASRASSSSSSDELFGAASRPRAIRGTRSAFILGDRLGDGAFATVKEGIDENTLRIVAVKILDTRRARRMRGGLDAVEREIAVQKRLKRHPNLIELIDVIRQPARDRLYIVLEMASGCTVEELRERASGVLPESQVARLVFQALHALQYMHGKGVVHRDIKPSNMMLSASGVLKISDFGVAEFLNEYRDDDKVSRTSGSPAFQAPEIATGQPGYSGRKVDVWALGVTTFFLLTGRVPFVGDSVVSLFANIGRGQFQMPDSFSPQLCDFLQRMLTVDWRARSGVDELLKHAWVQRGAAELSDADKAAQGWVPVPRREFGILQVVKRMYRSDADAQSAAPAREEVPEEGRACCIQ